MRLDELFNSWALYESTAKQLWDADKAGAGVLAVSKGEFLLAKRSASCPAPHTWCPPGGSIEPGEINPEHAAEREFREETGYDGEMELIPLKTTIYDSGFTFFSYIGLLSDKFDPNPDEKWAGETEEFRWVNLEGLKNIENKHHGLKELLKDREAMMLVQRAVKNGNG